MKIDVFSHIFPSKHREALWRLVPSPESYRALKIGKSMRGLWDLDIRFQVLSEYGDFKQVLATALPALDLVPNSKDAAEVARRVNDEIAELIAKHPDNFIAGVATLPVNDIDDTLKEIDRSIQDLGFKGILLYTNIGGKPLDLPEFMPLYEKMAGYDLPIWIHPQRDNTMSDYKTETTSKYGLSGVFGWPYETAAAMTRLVFSGVFDKYPNIKFITHHCGGGLVPFFERRIADWWDIDKEHGFDNVGTATNRLAKHPAEYFRMFYADTAVNGSTPALMCAYHFFGVDHLIFGTDMPFDKEHGHMLIRENIKAIEQMDIPDSDKKKIFEDNARKLLRLAP